MGAPPQGARRKIRAPPAERQETRDKRDGKRQAHGQAPSAEHLADYKFLTDLATATVQADHRAADADANYRM